MPINNFVYPLVLEDHTCDIFSLFQSSWTKAMARKLCIVILCLVAIFLLPLQNHVSQTKSYISLSHFIYIVCFICCKYCFWHNDAFRARLLYPPLKLHLHSLAKTVPLLNFPMWVFFLVQLHIDFAINNLLKCRLCQFLLTLFANIKYFYFYFNFLLVSLNFSTASLKAVFNHKVTNN